jgi:hypothetical protein
MTRDDVSTSEDPAALAARLTSATLGAIDELTTGGWLREDFLTTFRLTAGRDGTGVQLSGQLLSIHPLLRSGTLRWQSGEGFIEFRVSDQGTLEFAEQSALDLQNIFSDDEMGTGRKAFQGDLEAAITLSGRWTAVADIEPAQAMRAANDVFRWVVLRDAAAVSRLLFSQPWWDLAALVQHERPLIILIQSAGSDLRVWTQSVLAATLDEITLEEVNGYHLTLDLPQMMPNLAPATAPDPRVLIPLGTRGSSTEMTTIARSLRQPAAACCWAELASKVYVEEDRAILEFFGLRREEWSMPASGADLEDQEITALFTLWRASTSSENPDRLLAVRQVVSLQTEAPWHKAADIDSASQPLYTAMRSEASGEALRTQREARALALSVARDTADSTLALAKSTVERTIAIFLSIGAVIVAETTKALTSSQASDLRTLLACILFALAPWSFLIEGRAITTPTAAFPDDLKTFSSLLSVSDRTEILATEGFVRARQQAWIARIAVPTAYIVAGILTLLVANT